MNQPVRVLHVLGSLHMGGAESRIMDLYRHIDTSLVQFDFVVHTQEQGVFEEEIARRGGRVYRVPRFRIYNLLAYQAAWKKFFVSHKEFKVVQGHMTSTAALYLPIAKRSGVDVTIAHARSAGVDKGVKGLLTRILRRNLVKKTDYCFACSDLAGISVFGKRSYEQGMVTVIPNAIAATKFVYDEMMREQIREELHLENQFVIGHVGRFHHAKNHEFLIEIFERIHHRNPNAVLLLVGDGPLMSAIKELVVARNLSDAVIFAGMQEAVEKYYQGMDYFLFPSRFEGMPGSVLEAQAAGLRIVMSDRITRQAVLTDLVQIMSLEEAPEQWAQEVLQSKDYVRTNRYEEIQAKDYDILGQSHKMQQFYLTGKL